MDAILDFSTDLDINLFDQTVDTFSKDLVMIKNAQLVLNKFQNILILGNLPIRFYPIQIMLNQSILPYHL